MLNRFGDEEIQAVTSVIKSGELSGFYHSFKGGPKVQEFEEAFAEKLGVEYAVSTSSGSTALQTALMACGIGYGDEVITTPYTFIATVTSIILVGATPVLVDVDPRTYTISPKQIDYAVKPYRTKAIIPVHLLGHPVAMDEILDIAQYYKLKVIEDCAQSLGAKYKGKNTGTLGDLGIFSFQETKTISTGGEGGMVVTNDKSLADRCREIRNHGEKYANASLIGNNFRLTEMQAAFGLEQLKKLDYFNRLQVENAKYIVKRLPKGIYPPYVSPDVEHSFFIIGCTCNEEEMGIRRDDLIAWLKDEEIIQPKAGHVIGKGYDKLAYQLPALQKYRRYCPVAENLLKISLWLDVHRFRDSKEELDFYLKMLKEAIG